jgi:transposase
VVDHRAAPAEQTERRAALGDREVLNGIYWRRRTGSPRTDIPERYGPAMTCYNRLVSWARIGAWDRIFEAISRRRFADDRQFLDRCPPACANGQKGGSEETSAPLGMSLKAASWGAREAGLRRKSMPLSTPMALPILLKLTPGQAHNGRSAADTLDGLGQRQILVADRGYDLDALRARLARRGAWRNIKPMHGRVNIPSFRSIFYRFRDLVECSFNKLKQFRAVATSYEKHPHGSCQARRHPNMVRLYESVTDTASFWTRAGLAISDDTALP